MGIPMSITVVDETIPVAHNDGHLSGLYDKARESEIERLTTVRRQARSAAEHQSHDADVGIPLVDDRMRLPSFAETCPHVRDKIIPLNGGRFNVDHYLRVVRGITLKGATFADLRLELLWMAAIMLVLLLIASLRFRKKLG